MSTKPKQSMQDRARADAHAAIQAARDHVSDLRPRGHDIPATREMDAEVKSKEEATMPALPSKGTKTVRAGQLRIKSGRFNRFDAEFAGPEWDAFLAEIRTAGGNHTPVQTLQLNPDAFEIIDGERRWRACKALDLPVLIEIREAVTDAQKQTLERLFLTANEKRSDRSWASKCLAMKGAWERRGKPAQKEFAAAMNLPLGSVGVCLADAALVELIQGKVKDIVLLPQQWFRAVGKIKSSRADFDAALQSIKDPIMGAELLVALRKPKASAGTATAMKVSRTSDATTFVLPPLDDKVLERVEKAIRDVLAKSLI